MKVFVKNNTLVFQNNKNMKAVKSISFSLAYNPEILEINPHKNINLSKSEEASGFTRYTLSFKEIKDFIPQSTLLELSFKKLREETAYLNIVNVEFIDEKNNIYRLSTSNIVF